MQFNILENDNRENANINILENLEFIADQQTSAQTNKTYEYQKTLLKAVICANQLSITNQFYQSLIKRRLNR